MVTKELWTKFANGFGGEKTQPFMHLRVEIGKLFMDRARGKHRNANFHRWEWQRWGGLPVVRVEDGVVELI